MLHVFTTLQKLGLYILDLVYPPLCHICGQTLAENGHICNDCLNAFKFQNFKHEKFSISECIRIDEAWALFEFDENCQKLIHNLKYSGKRQAVLVVLEHYRSQIRQLFGEDSYDHILPVPLHKLKQRERGYNQVAHVCHWLAELLGSKVNTELVARVKYTKSQTKLSAEEREQNMVNAFEIVAGSMEKGDRILIVDDVITTGATSNAIAAVLRAGGATKVDLISLSSPK